jgi:predicted Kef-type K+ transport protein
MHHATPLITTIVGGLVLAFILGMLANKLRISPLLFQRFGLRQIFLQ